MSKIKYNVIDMIPLVRIVNLTLYIGGVRYLPYPDIPMLDSGVSRDVLSLHCNSETYS